MAGNEVGIQVGQKPGCWGNDTVTDAATNELSVLQRLRGIQALATVYFDEAIQTLPNVRKQHAFDDYDGNLYGRGYWGLAPEELQKTAQELAGRLAALAQETASTIRRSPLLTEADEREAGHSFKGMRSALRFSSFEFEEIEVLHDEGTVLGVQPPRESVRNVAPTDAKEAFNRWFDSLQTRLELADVRPIDGRDVPVTGSRPIAAGYRPGTAFIMMWISRERPELDDVSQKIKECFARFGITAVRADDIEHDDIITQRILDEIKTAEFLVADITGERPSVYYEIGFAHAIGRRVMMFRRAGTPIHFDIAAYNCPEYKNLSALGDMLMKRLEASTGEPPKSPA